MLGDGGDEAILGWGDGHEGVGERKIRLRRKK
jgi:hypothetical protein